MHLPLIGQGSATEPAPRSLGAWPLRRLVVVAALFPVLLAAMTGTAGGWAPAAAPGWTALVALTSLVAAATLATYLPQPGAGRVAS